MFRTDGLRRAILTSDDHVRRRGAHAVSQSIVVEPDPGCPVDRDLLTRLLARGWPSYMLVTLLQMKVLWLIWRFRDLTTGDTGAYFNGAYLWYERLGVNIAWSPLYTAFYGSVFALTRDAY